MDNQYNAQQGSSAVWWVAGILVLVALAAWYFYGKQTPAPSTGTSTAEQTQLPAPTASNTTADISTDLSQLADDAAALNADAAASAADVSGF